jgi:hypothetical protein
LCPSKGTYRKIYYIQRHILKWFGLVGFGILVHIYLGLGSYPYICDIRYIEQKLISFRQTKKTVGTNILPRDHNQVLRPSILPCRQMLYFKLLKNYQCKLKQTSTILIQTPYLVLNAKCTTVNLTYYSTITLWLRSAFQLKY